MAQEEQKTISIEALNREDLLKLSVPALQELKAYLVTIRQKLLSKTELVSAVCEEREKSEARIAKLKALPAEEREALKQDLAGDHFKEGGETAPGESAQ